MCERFDTVRANLNLPILKADGYNPVSLAEERVLQEPALLEDMGVDFYARGSQESNVPEFPSRRQTQQVDLQSREQVHPDL